MSIKLRKEIIFVLSFIAAAILYWPSMNGTPIWDDYTYWFQDPVMKPAMSYITIWKQFGWPFSVSLQKLMLSILQKKYFYYHTICFCLHFVNSLLVYKLGRVLRLRFPVIYFLFFLLHPTAVIATAWMIQIKTLISFLFGLSSLLFFLKGNKDIRYMALSWGLFFISVTSKSASLTLPLILFVISFKTYRFSKLHLLLPFFILSSWGAYRVMTSSVTKEGQDKVEVISKIKEDHLTEKVEPKKIESPVPETPKAPVVVKVEVPAPKKEKIRKGIKKKAKTVTPVVEVPQSEPKAETKPELKIPEPVQAPRPEPESPKPLSKIPLPDFGLVAQTMNYYFWQGVMPLNNEPVKGLNFKRPGWEEYLHFFFIFTLLFIFWKRIELIYLGAAYVLLLPFLGIVPAPFMNITWVSDQHLYLALPALLAFWLKVMEKIKIQFSFVIAFIFVIFFSFYTYKANQFYKNQFTFFEASLAYDPTNVPIAYNLAFARIMNNDLAEAYTILENLMLQAEDDPTIRKNLYFPYALNLYNTLNLKEP